MVGLNLTHLPRSTLRRSTRECISRLH
jgi:hypothetical protein